MCFKRPVAHLKWDMFLEMADVRYFQGNNRGYLASLHSALPWCGVMGGGEHFLTLASDPEM